jgi:hypothetical protein
VPAPGAFADGLADRALYLVERGPARAVPRRPSVPVVDDDIGGPYSVGPRDVFERSLEPGAAPRQGRVVALYAEPRSWKGRADLGRRSREQLGRLAPGAALVVLFGHPRLVDQIPGQAPVLVAWHGQTLMQRAAARWVRRAAG